MEMIYVGVIKNFAFKVHAQAFIRNSGYRSDSLKKLALDIFNRYIRSEHQIYAVLKAYLDVCHSIDQAKIETIGFKSSSNRSNALMATIAGFIAREMEFSATDIEIIDLQLELFENCYKGDVAWPYIKLTMLRQFITKNLSARELARTISFDSKLDEKAFDAFKKSVGDLSQQNNMAMSELMALRKYGVKTSFFQDGFFHGSSEVWAFVDARQFLSSVFENHIFEMTASSLPIAVIALGKKRDFVQQGNIAVSKKIRLGKHEWTRYELPASISMVINSNGELDASNGYGFLPLRDYFVREGKEMLYEILRLSQIMRLHDLVVPVMTVAKMPEMKFGTVERLKILLGSQSINLDPKLIVPRLRSLENVNQLASELEVEIERASEETAKRSVHRHEVVCHIRRLPKGKRPTPAARARAEAYGITLADDETFIRAFERGEGELQKVVHEAITRKGA